MAVEVELADAAGSDAAATAVDDAVAVGPAGPMLGASLSCESGVTVGAVLWPCSGTFCPSVERDWLLMRNVAPPPSATSITAIITMMRGDRRPEDRDSDAWVDGGDCVITRSAGVTANAADDPVWGFAGLIGPGAFADAGESEDALSFVVDMTSTVGAMPMSNGASMGMAMSSSNFPGLERSSKWAPDEMTLFARSMSRTSVANSEIDA